MRGPRWVLVGSILGSGAVFVEGSVTSVALPAIAREFHLGISGLQWVMNGYLLTLTALMLFGGALGDRFSRRRVFGIGLVAFAAASAACAVAPSLVLLVVARVAQGIAGALVVPNSLALLETAYVGEARGTAIGRWAAWSAVSSALGPLAGGWLIDATSWRFVFLFVAPFALAAVVAVGFAGSVRRDAQRETKRVDYAGAALVTLSLSGIVGALIVGEDMGFRDARVLSAAIGGILLFAAFLVVEHRAKNPLLPLDVFRSREFTGVNATTLLVYAGLNGLILFLMLQLQNGLEYSAVAAGASLLPINGLMLALSPIAGRIAERIGPRIPMVVGALVGGVGMLLFMRADEGARYLTGVLPAAVVFGLGLSSFVAPLTAVALRSLDEKRAGIASGVNNAVARLAGLLATAIIPFAVGLGGSKELRGDALSSGFARAMMICAALCGAGALVAALTISGSKPPGKASSP